MSATAIASGLPVVLEEHVRAGAVGVPSDGAGPRGVAPVVAHRIEVDGAPTDDRAVRQLPRHLHVDAVADPEVLRVEVDGSRIDRGLGASDPSTLWNAPVFLCPRRSA